MIYLRCVFLLVLTTGWASPCFAAQPSLNDLVVLGLRVNMQLKIEQAEVDKAQQAIVVEQSVFDPEAFTTLAYDYRKSPFVNETASGRFATDEYQGTLGLRKRFTTGLVASASLITERVSGEDPGSTLDPRYRSAFVLELNQPLLRNQGNTVNRTAVIRAGYQLEQAHLGYLLAAQELAIQLEYALRELALQHRIVALRLESLKLADELIADNRRRFAEGLVPITEIQEAESARAARRLLLAQARQNRDRLIEQLNRQLDGQLPPDFDPSFLFSDDAMTAAITDDVEPLLQRARSKRLDFKISQLSLASQKKQLEFFRLQRKPRLDLRLQAGLNGLAGRQYADTAYRGNWSDSFESMSSADGYEWGVALEFSAPLGNRAAQSRYRQSRAAIRQQRYRVEDIDLQLQTEIKEVLLGIEHTAHQLDIALELERLASVSLQQEQRRLDEGLSDTFRLLTFQDNMIRARIDRLEAVTAFHLAQAEKDFVMGEIFERHNIRLDHRREDFQP
ncbi:MAG: TolC family protein [Pelovirga sp.]